MPKKIKIKQQLGAGRPKSATDKADLPEKMTSAGELPKKVVGSHMGSLYTAPLQTTGPAIKGPVKPPKPVVKAPPQ